VTEYPADLAARPAPEGVTLVCLTHLDAAHAAGQRVTDPSDVEALHDFRVAIRRLRSTLRTYRSQLDVVPRKLRNGLRDLTRSTTPGRDAEVLIASVKALEPKLERGQRAGLPWLLARFAERRDRAYEEIQDDLASEFPRLERRLRKALRVAGKVPGDPPVELPTLGAVAAALLSEHVDLLVQEVGTLQSGDDESTAHGIRITAKHLRYLLEPLAEAHSEAQALLGRLKAIQTQLGDLHDLQVLAAELADAVGDAGAERARRLHDLTLPGTPRRAPTPRKQPRAATTGVLALARLVRQAQDDAFRVFEAERQSGSLANLQGAVASVAAALARPAASPAPLPQQALSSTRP
jgi:CHAD domain-containing protein